MKPLRLQLEQIQAQKNTPWYVLEQDYLLSWVLWGIARVPILKENMVFKGGTALKKCYFGDYRFSQGLDFSLRKPLGDLSLEEAIRQACALSESEHKENISDLSLEVKKYFEKEGHPHHQNAYSIHGRFPWQRTALTHVMVEISQEEILVKEPILKKVIHGYVQDFEADILVYPLEEVVLEKLRAILQNTKKFHERGWGRSRARDYYDLWHIFQTNDLDTKNFRVLLQEKCAIKDISFKGTEDFFDTKVLQEVEKTWEKWLGHLVENIPSSVEVIKVLKEKIPEMLSQ